jgi:predicted metal-dependent hydrolase
MMKAPREMAMAVYAVSVEERREAIRVAEKKFFEALEILREFDDFSEKVNREMAAAAAAAEVKFLFN